MDSPLDAARELCESINKICNDISEVVVYKREVVLIREWLVEASQKLLTSPEITDSSFTFEISTALSYIQATLRELETTVQMLSEQFWINIAFKDPVEGPTEMFNKSMENLYQQFSICGVDINKYGPTDDDYITDYHELYNVFAAAPPGQVPEAPARLASVNKFLEEHHLPLGVSANKQAIEDIFKNLKSYEINRDDYSIESQIGYGATARVFVGRNRKNGMRVAIKQLTSSDLSAAEVQAFRREIAILSSLKHRALISFVGATSANPYWIVTEFCPHLSLYNRLQSSRRPDPTQITKIAYYIAEGMAYLHSKNIIHRDLKTCNVLMTEKDEPKICDFGISRSVEDDAVLTGNVGTYNYMAPEVIMKSKYSFKADVFSYGLLLWELLTFQIPYSSFRDIQIAHQILAGNRPDIPKNTPIPLRNLINACWSQDVDNRPTFDQILGRMRNFQMAFPGSNASDLEQFYKDRRIEIESDEVDESVFATRRLSLTKIVVEKKIETPDMKIMKLIRTNPSSPELTNLLRSYVVLAGNDQATNLKPLLEAGFVTAMVQSFELIGDTMSACQALTAALDAEAQQAAFVNAGGVDLILRLLQDGSKTKTRAGRSLAAFVAHYVGSGDALALVGPLLSLGDCQTAASVLQFHPALNAAREMSPYIEGILSSARKDRGIIIAHYIKHAGLSDRLAAIISTKDIISTGSVELGRKVSSLDTFAKRLHDNDVADVCKAISDLQSTNDQKATACAVAMAFPVSVLEVLAQHEKFITDVISVNDEPDPDRPKHRPTRNRETAGRLLFKLAQFPRAAGVLLGREKYLHKNVKVPAVFSLFIRIAAFYPGRVCAMEWVMDYCLQLLKDKKMTEPVLRLLGILSTAPEFGKYNEPVSAEIGELLKDSEFSPLQMALAVGVLYNISAKFEIGRVHRQLLLLAESGCGFSGMAFRIIAREPLAKARSRASGRLVDLVTKFLNSADAYGIYAACEVLQKMAKDKDYSAVVGTPDTAKRINGALTGQTRPDLVIALMKTLNAFKFKASSGALHACDSILMDPYADQESCDEIQEERQMLILDD